MTTLEQQGALKMPISKVPAGVFFIKSKPDGGPTLKGGLYYVTRIKSDMTPEIRKMDYASLIWERAESAYGAGGPRAQFHDRNEPVYVLTKTLVEKWNEERFAHSLKRLATEQAIAKFGPVVEKKAALATMAVPEETRQFLPPFTIDVDLLRSLTSGGAVALAKLDGAIREHFVKGIETAEQRRKEHAAREQERAEHAQKKTSALKSLLDELGPELSAMGAPENILQVYHVPARSCFEEALRKHPNPSEAKEAAKAKFKQKVMDYMSRERAKTEAQRA